MGKTTREKMLEILLGEDNQSLVLHQEERDKIFAEAQKCSHLRRHGDTIKGNKLVYSKFLDEKPTKKTKGKIVHADGTQQPLPKNVHLSHSLRIYGEEPYIILQGVFYYANTEGLADERGIRKGRLLMNLAGDIFIEKSVKHSMQDFNNYKKTGETEAAYSRTPELLNNFIEAKHISGETGKTRLLEVFKGITLEELLEHSQKPTPEQWLDITVQTFDLVMKLHAERKVLHNDVRLANFVATYDSTSNRYIVSLIDFGEITEILDTSGELRELNNLLSNFAKAQPNSFIKTLNEDLNNLKTNEEKIVHLKTTINAKKAEIEAAQTSTQNAAALFGKPFQSVAHESLETLDSPETLLTEAKTVLLEVFLTYCSQKLGDANGGMLSGQIVEEINKNEEKRKEAEKILKRSRANSEDNIEFQLRRIYKALTTFTLDSLDDESKEKINALQSSWEENDILKQFLPIININQFYETLQKWLQDNTGILSKKLDALSKRIKKREKLEKEVDNTIQQLEESSKRYQQTNAEILKNKLLELAPKDSQFHLFLSKKKKDESLLILLKTWKDRNDRSKTENSSPSNVSHDFDYNQIELEKENLTEQFNEHTKRYEENEPTRNKIHEMLNILECATLNEQEKLKLEILENETNEKLELKPCLTDINLSYTLTSPIPTEDQQQALNSIKTLMPGYSEATSKNYNNTMRELKEEKGILIQRLLEQNNNDVTQVWELIEKAEAAGNLVEFKKVFQDFFIKHKVSHFPRLGLGVITRLSPEQNADKSIIRCILGSEPLVKALGLRKADVDIVHKNMLGRGNTGFWTQRYHNELPEEHPENKQIAKDTNKIISHITKR